MDLDKTGGPSGQSPRLGFNFNKPIVIHLPNVSVTYSAKSSAKTQIKKEKKQELPTKPPVSSSVETPPKSPDLIRTQPGAEPIQKTCPESVSERESIPACSSSPIRQPSPAVLQPEAGPSNQSSHTVKSNSPSPQEETTSTKPFTKIRTKRTPLRAGWPKNVSSMLAKSVEKESTEASKLECPRPSQTPINNDSRISPFESTPEEQYKTPPSSDEEKHDEDERGEKEEESTPTQRRRSARVAAKSNDAAPPTVKRALITRRKSLGTSIIKKSQLTSAPKSINSFGYPTSKIVTMANRHKSFIKKVVDELKSWSEFARKRLA